MRISLPQLGTFLLLMLSLAVFSSAQTASAIPPEQNPQTSNGGGAPDKSAEKGCSETAPVAMLDQWNRLVVEYFDAHTGEVCREANVKDGQFVAAAFDSTSDILFGVRGNDANLVAYSLADGNVTTLDEAPVDALEGQLVLDAAHHWIVVGTQQFFYDEQGRLYRMEDQSPVEMIRS